MSDSHSPDDRSGDERRRDARFHARFDVRFRGTTDAARAFNAFSLNFSAGGLCVRSVTPRSIGDRLQLDVLIGDERFSLQGVVAWTRGEALGVRFEGVSPSLRARLETVARSLAVTSTPAGHA